MIIILTVIGVLAILFLIVALSSIHDSLFIGVILAISTVSLIVCLIGYAIYEDGGFQETQNTSQCSNFNEEDTDFRIKYFEVQIDALPKDSKIEYIERNLRKYEGSKLCAGEYKIQEFLKGKLKDSIKE